MAIDEWVTGDIVTAINFNKRTVRRGTTSEIDALSDSVVNIGDLFFDTDLAKPKFCTVVVARAYHILSPVGAQQMWVPAIACYPAVTTPCSNHTQVELPTNDVDIFTLDFDGAANEIAKYDWTPPQAWDPAIGLKFKPYWTAGSGSGTVEFDFSGGAFANSDPLDADITTGFQTSTDTLLDTDDIHISPQTSAVTINGTAAVFDWVQIKILRDAVSDTHAADVRFMGFMLEYSLLFPTSVG